MTLSSFAKKINLPLVLLVKLFWSCCSSNVRDVLQLRE